YRHVQHVTAHARWPVDSSCGSGPVNACGSSKGTGGAWKGSVVPCLRRVVRRVLPQYALHNVACSLPFPAACASVGRAWGTAADGGCGTVSGRKGVGGKEWAERSGQRSLVEGRRAWSE